ncbi:MAG TPA: hypothetical protein VMS09_16895 [Paenibacillus sp.]|uniref:hypothetical protein n=1 Tax=Paenibacillus sp. TaxID=58172 RepID=UPI0028D68A49|nr:hypothetical protein [Paenibacillus sp.]HUC93668.1 hypothetical protein [Paenibacillus sp.]
MFFVKALGIVISLFLVTDVSAIENDFKKNEIVRSFEKQCDCKLKYPSYLPFKPSSVNVESDKNGGIRIIYENKRSNQTLNVDIGIANNYNHVFKGEKVLLADGTQASYYYDRTRSVAEIMLFEKNDLLYGIGLKINEESPTGPEILRKVADSMK